MTADLYEGSRHVKVELWGLPFGSHRLADVASAYPRPELFTRICGVISEVIVSAPPGFAGQPSGARRAVEAGGRAKSGERGFVEAQERLVGASAFFAAAAERLGIERNSRAVVDGAIQVNGPGCVGVGSRMRPSGAWVSRPWSARPRQSR